MIAGLATMVAATPSPTLSPTPGAVVVNTNVEGGFKKEGADTDPERIIVDGAAKTGSQYEVQTSYYSVLYLWLKQGSPETTQEFDVSVDTIDTEISTTMYIKNPPIRSITDSTRAEIGIGYKCPAVPTKRYKITAEISIKGWKNITVTWQKDCSVPAPVFNPPGMSGFEQFCLVVFIITLVLCVGGCGYNYISRGKSGKEIIPGYHLIERYICCQKERAYNAGMSYDEQIGDDSYSTPYQTDL